MIFTNTTFKCNQSVWNGPTVEITIEAYSETLKCVNIEVTIRNKQCWSKKKHTSEYLRLEEFRYYMSR